MEEDEDTGRKRYRIYGDDPSYRDEAGHRPRGGGRRDASR